MTTSTDILVRPNWNGGTPPSADARPKLLGLQILRFVAALSVVLFHVGSGMAIEFGQPNYFAFGAAGVDVFFVISGFIIAFTTDASKGAGHFAMRRIVRIVPLYWTLTLGVVVIAAITPDLLNSTQVSAEALWKSLFFIPFAKANGAVHPLLYLGWSLNYEMFFYAVYAVSIALGFRSALAPAAAIVLLVAVGYAFPVEDSVVFKFYTNPLMLEFVLGIGIYFLFTRDPARFRDHLPAILCALGLAVLARALIPALPWVVANGVPAGLLVASVLPLALRPTRIVATLVLLGDASYSLYLSHPYLVQVWIKMFPTAPDPVMQGVLVATACSLAVLASLILYGIVERPAQSVWKARERRVLALAR